MFQESVLAYFEQHGGLSGSTNEEKLDCHYLDEGVIDSLGIVSMIADFEEQFHIRFEAEHLQSEEFQTPRGILSIIEKLARKAA